MHNIELDFISTFIFGATALAFIYHAILYIFSRDKFLLHYLIYLFFTGLFLYMMSGLFAAVYGDDKEYYYRGYLKESLQIFYLLSYFNFIVESIELSKSSKFTLFKYWRAAMAVLIIYGILFPLGLIYFPDFNFSIAFLMVRIFIFGLTAAMLHQSYKLRRIKFQQIILYGCTIYFVFGIISFATNLMPNVSEMAIFPLEWLMIGSFIDIIFFSIAVAYRNRKRWKSLNKTLLEEANKVITMQTVVLEKQRELENERTRIAADMHDDLGSGLTKITYLSQMAILKLDTDENLIKIKNTATELVGNMSELIWVMKEENNTLEDLATYIKSYAVDYLENNKISFKMKMPVEFPEFIISGADRRNLFLSVKESLHNIVKHSKADQVNLEISVDQLLKIEISDNGIGLDSVSNGSPYGGNGLKNMKTRMESIKGNLLIDSSNGTKVCLSVPINEMD